jgi:hypothetical protein
MKVTQDRLIKGAMRVFIRIGIFVVISMKGGPKPGRTRSGKKRTDQQEIFFWFRCSKTSMTKISMMAYF